MTLRQLFLQNVAQTSTEPLMLDIVSANGNYLIDSNGKKYLDLISGISVSSLGHGHPEIVKAVQNQAENHMHLMVYGELIQAPQVILAEKLTSILPASLNSVFFVNAGTEATEGAMKLAKRFTGKSGFVAHTKAYHGSTQGALSLMDEPYFTDAFRPLLPNIKFIEQNDVEAIHNLGQDIAAIIIEPVQAEKGALPCTKEYLQAVRNFCDSNNTLLIFDEIQTGMGRTGTMFAFEQFQVVPDVLLIGKAFGGGMPLAAFVASKEIMEVLSFQPVLGHITTFGGHPVCCAAALAALTITHNQLSEFNIEKKNLLFRSLLKHNSIIRVTGMGLLLAIHLQSEEICKLLIQKCLNRGLFTDWFLHAPNCLRIAPPLAITMEEITSACGFIVEAMEEINLEIGGSIT